MSKGKSSLIDELYLTKSLVGEQEIITGLKKLRTDKTGNDIINHVFITINSTLQVTIDEIIQSNSRSDMRKIAIGFNYYFLTSIFTFTCGEIYKQFPVNINQATIYKCGQIVKKAKRDNPKTEIDQLVCKFYHVLNDNFIKFKKELKNGPNS